MRRSQDICAYYGMEDRCTPVDWQCTITVCNWAAEMCSKLRNKVGKVCAKVLQPPSSKEQHKTT